MTGFFYFKKREKNFNIYIKKYKMYLKEFNYPEDEEFGMSGLK
jgi:hypothetical protein